MHFDPVTCDPVLLYPEGVLPLDESTFDIIRLCSGQRTVTDIVAALAEEYDADKRTLLNHVTECLGQLQEKLLLTFASATQSSNRVDSPAIQTKPKRSHKKKASRYRPYLLLAELTYRCPLHCPYCSNPAAYPNGQ